MASITTQSPRILVLDADLVPALTIARSLGKRQYLVEVASARHAPVASFSRHAVRCWRYPDPLLDAEAFLHWLQQHLLQERYELVIPVTERTLVPLSAHRIRFAGTRLAMADAASLDRVLDKGETFRLADSLGVPVPRSAYLATIGELVDILPGLTYPVVVKPSRSVSAGESGYSKRSVSYANTAPELQRQCEQALRHSPVILQSYFQGLGAGIELIARDGEILYAFQHIRLHEVPLTGGGSSFRASAPIEPALLAAAQQLMQALRWTGVAMVEFKWDPASGRFCLMEINGRFWGSLPLAVAAGADFPAMLAELCLTGTLSEYPAYRPGVYCRNLASDLMWHEMVLRSARPGPTGAQDQAQGGPNQVPSAALVLRDLARMFSPRHYFDTQSLSDPLPGLVEIQRLLLSYGARLGELVADRTLALQQRLLWRNGTVREQVRAAHSILFVCYGNINRSALAEALLAAMLPPGSQIRLLSAGFHPQQGRRADPKMCQIAQESGFDLSASRSRALSDALLEESDLIFVMEMGQRRQLLSRQPRLAGRVFLLGPGSREAGRGAAEIPDPYNRSEAIYRSCFAQIHQAVTRLAAAAGVEHVS